MIDIDIRKHVARNIISDTQPARFLIMLDIDMNKHEVRGDGISAIHKHASVCLKHVRGDAAPGRSRVGHSLAQISLLIEVHTDFKH